ncbi:MAG TPA: deoxyribodipyrimidine photo-lyase [Mesorhizobium sp.]|jgi:deoxyribodipyrimidine photo-lyase|nr:deoxyribodipyrimidine photo-lyase [Mesorhizobium sp.]
MSVSKAKADEAPALVLFRTDRRVADNRALLAASESGAPVAAAFVLDEESPGLRATGGAKRWWLHHSLKALAGRLQQLGVELTMRRGPMAEVVRGLLRETGAEKVYWNRRYHPVEHGIDRDLKTDLQARGIEVADFGGFLLHEPDSLRTKAGGPFKIYAPFVRALFSGREAWEPVAPPKRLRPWGGRLRSDRLEDWGLLPTKPNWAGRFSEVWTPGEAAGLERLAAFVRDGVGRYAQARDLSGQNNSSKLSAHLAHGEITPAQVLRAVAEADGVGAEGKEKFRRELAWRDFCHHLLFHNPDLATKPFNPLFERFPYRGDPEELRAWRRGQTGYPIVDAAMRELWTFGAMPNRLRLIAGSFLVKHLLTDWREGEAWFWDTLVDADPANNAYNWQWIAGSGPDPAPYFRIFNPITQGQKFDPEGDHIRRHVPELARLRGESIHTPWEATQAELRAAGVELGVTYPWPIVDHGQARERALAAFRLARGREQG